MADCTAREGMRTIALAAALALAAFLSAGCACRFERDWYFADDCCVPGDRLAGRWAGTWESHENGHSGRLRAIITRCADGTYRARYHATFATVVPFAYETNHTAAPAGAVTSVCGEEDLGWLAGGVYRYEGSTDGRSLTVCFQADRDHGVFRLQRVDGCAGDACCTPADAALANGGRQSQSR